MSRPNLIQKSSGNKKKAIKFIRFCRIKPDAGYFRLKRQVEDSKTPDQDLPHKSSLILELDDILSSGKSSCSLITPYSELTSLQQRAQNSLANGSRPGASFSSARPLIRLIFYFLELAFFDFILIVVEAVADIFSQTSSKKANLENLVHKSIYFPFAAFSRSFTPWLVVRYMILLSLVGNGRVRR